jgi:hypothetical protein
MDGRHHRASRDVQIILVPVPVAGTVKNTRYVHPPHYPRQGRSPWRPRTKPPTKAERVARFLDQCRRQEESVREMLKPDLALLKARWSIAV